MTVRGALISPDGGDPGCLPLPGGELERAADGVVAVVGDEGQREDGHGHRYVLRRVNGRGGVRKPLHDL